MTRKTARDRAIERLAPPLEDRFRHVIDGVARARGFPVTGDVARLGAEVARLSRAYNSRDGDLGGMLAARLGFSFARDVPKAGAAAAELVLASLIRIPEGRALRVLDVGAGLGASSWGLVRALAARGERGSVHATLVDADRDALELAAAIARAAAGEGQVSLRVETHTRDLSRPAPSVGQRFDVVLMGQVLSEHERERPASERAAAHAELLRGHVERLLEPGGSLVVIEPALRERARHLQAVRDILASSGVSPFAPCLHAGACPLLVRDQDWCHEDLEVDLPEWLVPVARAAGLRYQGLTFSYLVLRRDGRTLPSVLGARALRLIAAPRLTKGKSELLLCGELSAGPGLARLTLLDRDASEPLRAASEARRGDLLAIEPLPGEAAGRLARGGTAVRVLPAPGEPGTSAAGEPGEPGGQRKGRCV